MKAEKAGYGAALKALKWFKGSLQEACGGSRQWRLAMLLMEEMRRQVEADHQVGLSGCMSLVLGPARLSIGLGGCSSAGLATDSFSSDAAKAAGRLERAENQRKSAGDCSELEAMEMRTALEHHALAQKECLKGST